MPIYEYACRRCGKRFETLVLSARHAEEVACPCCGGKEVLKQISCANTLSGGGRALCSGSGASRFS